MSSHLSRRVVQASLLTSRSSIRPLQAPLVSSLRRHQSTSAPEASTKVASAVSGSSNPQSVGTEEKGVVTELGEKELAELAPVEDVIPAYEGSGAPGTSKYIYKI